jgi:hypothetical protein
MLNLIQPSPVINFSYNMSKSFCIFISWNVTGLEYRIYNTESRKQRPGHFISFHEIWLYGHCIT